MQSFFVEVIVFAVFSGKFGEIWAKILRIPKNFPAPTPMVQNTQITKLTRRTGLYKC